MFLLYYLLVDAPSSKHRGMSEVARFNDRSVLSVAVHELHEMHEYARNKEQEQESSRSTVISSETLEHFNNYGKEVRYI